MKGLDAGRMKERSWSIEWNEVKQSEGWVKPRYNDHNTGLTMGPVFRNYGDNQTMLCYWA